MRKPEIIWCYRLQRANNENKFRLQQSGDTKTSWLLMLPLLFSAIQIRTVQYRRERNVSWFIQGRRRTKAFDINIKSKLH